jgi:hypothetical protein
VKASQRSPDGCTIYRLTWWAQLIDILVAAGCLFACYENYLQYVRGAWGKEWTFWLMEIFFLIVALSTALGPMFSRVVLDDDSITVKGILKSRSLQRSAIAGIKFRGTRSGRYAVLEGAAPARKRFVVPLCYRFDERWDKWISTLKNLDEAEDGAPSIIHPRDPQA